MLLLSFPLIQQLSGSQVFLFSTSQALLEKTGYTLDVTTGQRKYGGPPPGSTHAGVQPTVGTEVSAVVICVRD